MCLTHTEFHGTVALILSPPNNRHQDKAVVPFPRSGAESDSREILCESGAKLLARWFCDSEECVSGRDSRPCSLDSRYLQRSVDLRENDGKSHDPGSLQFVSAASVVPRLPHHLRAPRSHSVTGPRPTIRLKASAIKPA